MMITSLGFSLFFLIVVVLVDVVGFFLLLIVFGLVVVVVFFVPLAPVRLRSPLCSRMCLLLLVCLYCQLFLFLSLMMPCSLWAAYIFFFQVRSVFLIEDSLNLSQSSGSISRNVLLPGTSPFKIIVSTISPTLLCCGMLTDDSVSILSDRVFSLQSVGAASLPVDRGKKREKIVVMSRCTSCCKIVALTERAQKVIFYW